MRRIIKVACKGLFVFLVVCAVLAFWASLVGCGHVFFPPPLPEHFPEGKSMEQWMQEENVWPQGCGKISSTSEAFDPGKFSGTLTLDQ